MQIGGMVAALILLGFLVALGLLLLLSALGVGGATAIQGLLYKRRLKKLRADWRAEHFDAQGHRLPPADRGLCQACEKAYEKVYYLPSGRRLCQACYEAVKALTQDMNQETTDGPTGPDGTHL
jgi:hypothetical protein